MKKLLSMMLVSLLMVSFAAAEDATSVPDSGTDSTLDSTLDSNTDSTSTSDSTLDPTETYGIPPEPITPPTVPAPFGTEVWNTINDAFSEEMKNSEPGTSMSELMQSVIKDTEATVKEQVETADNVPFECTYVGMTFNEETNTVYVSYTMDFSTPNNSTIIGSDTSTGKVVYPNIPIEQLGQKVVYDPSIGLPSQLEQQLPVYVLPDFPDAPEPPTETPSTPDRDRDDEPEYNPDPDPENPEPTYRYVWVQKKPAPSTGR